MGEVYRAHDTRLDREVAVKVLPDSLTSDPDRLRRFEQEARAAAALNHPNILAVYQMATHEGVSYMVTELLEGETLRERLRRGPIQLRKAIDFGVQIAHGLAAAHEKGIVHRDLKPENLFVTKDGRVKILDFGLAKLTRPNDSEGLAPTLTEATEPGVVMGTVGYMSPEQVRGQTADPRSDIFAFGTVLYEMVTGKPTFRKPTKADTMSAILNDEPPSISQLAPATPPGLQRVVHRCLEKSPEQRFHSAHDLAFALDALSESGVSSPSGGRVQESWKHNRLRRVVAGVSVALVLGAAAIAYLWLRSESAPKLYNYIQLTHDGQRKGLVGTEGSRLYFYIHSPQYQGVAEMSTSGGESRNLPVLPSADFSPADLSPDGSKLLALDIPGSDGVGVGPIWSLPLFGGSPRRLGEIVASNAAWSPDANMLAYVKGPDIFIAAGDGSQPRRLATVEGSDVVFDPTWSPDAGHLRFGAVNKDSSSLWEVSLDGTGLHRLLPGSTTDPEYQCCGRWTPNGKYFLFPSRRQVWALPRSDTFLHRKPKPIQLTFSPMSLGGPLPSVDGKRLFVVGRIFRGELTRYDQKSAQFAPFLGGISAEFPAFSKDGQWVTYVSFPDGALWRSKVDGSERLQLTYPPPYPFPPMYARMPRWSPDGQKIVFFAWPPGKPAQIYEISRDGGTPQVLVADDQHNNHDPNWSPDGNRIVFCVDDELPTSEIHVLDLTTRQVTTLPESRGLSSPRWSPDGRYVPAESADYKRLVVFDFHTQKWTEVAKGQFGWLNWTKDGQYLEVIDQRGTGSVIRIRMSDGKIEQILDLKAFVGTGVWGISLSLAPDDSPLLLKETGTQDIYALDWEGP
jgi:serine/threonine protein kinase/Tol biopolymer transport system component